MFVLPKIAQSCIKPCAIDDANDAKDADAADVASGGEMPTVSGGRLNHGQTACEPVQRG